VSRVRAALEGHGVITNAGSASELADHLGGDGDVCLVIDPSLLSAAGAQDLARHCAMHPVATVAYGSITHQALESTVILAQQTLAQFVFHGTPNERSALSRALLLAPDPTIGLRLVDALAPNIRQLPDVLADNVVAMLRGATGASSPEELAAQSAFARRTMDRWIGRVGFRSARLLAAAARVARVYRAVVASDVPLKRLAAMVGYRSQRTLDQQLEVLAGSLSSTLRQNPLAVPVVVDRMTAALTLPSDAVSNGDARHASRSSRRMAAADALADAPRTASGRS
jgi:hypothetical protein